MDEISAEMFKSADPVAIEAFHSLLTSIWEEEELPKDFIDATVVPLFKNQSINQISIAPISPMKPGSVAHVAILTVAITWGESPSSLSLGKY